MKRKPPKKKMPAPNLESAERDIFDGINPGEMKVFADGSVAINPHWEILDPPEPIKRPGKTKPKKKSA